MTTPAERARQIDDEERRADNAAALQRALAYAANKRAEERAKLETLLGREPPKIKHRFKVGRRPILYEAFGQSLPLHAWAEKSGINHYTLRNRLKDGWPVEAALAAPLRTPLERALAEYVGTTPNFM